MKFSEFAQYLSKLEATTKRLEITALLSELIGQLPPKEIDKALYLSQGALRSPFESEKFNIAEKMVIRALSTAYETDPTEINKIFAATGDLGSTAYELPGKKEDQKSDITTVHEKLVEIAETSGAGSQEAKITKLAQLLQNLDQLSAKYVVRTILGTTRLGFTETTVIDALSQFIQGDKTLKQQIEEKYNQYPDIGLIAKKIKEKGIKGIHDIAMKPGVPINPQLAQRLSDLDEIMIRMEGTAWAEYKLDGTRVQLHIDRKNKVMSKEYKQTELFTGAANKFLVKSYTRNLDETTSQFPDIIDAAVEHIDAVSVILDGEAIGYDPATDKFLPFQESIKRKRKHDIEKASKEIPLRYFIFDILYLNGKPLLDKTLKERRELLSKIITEDNTLRISRPFITTEVQELADFYEESKAKGLEGLVIKNINSPYQAGARSYCWIKLKKGAEEKLEDDFDCVVLGYSFGKGARSQLGIGTFLVGVYDKKEDSFRSITKIGTGLKEDEWKDLKDKVDKLRVEEKPVNVDVKKEQSQTVWALPKIVVTVKADEITKSPTHTAGYALRFPRFIGYRQDKNPQDATTVEEVKDLYNKQIKAYY